MFTSLLFRMLSTIVLTLAPATWQFSATTPMTSYSSGSALAFNFPVEDGNHPTVNYFWTPQTRPMSGAMTALFGVTVSNPNVVFNYAFEPGNTCVFPAHVRLLMARNDYTKVNNKNFEFTRWWSNPQAVQLAPGSFELVVPLTPDNWSDIYGQSGSANPDQFALALQHPAMLGFSFGGGCFFGHGVNTSNGTATFVVINYYAQ